MKKSFPFFLVLLACFACLFSLCLVDNAQACPSVAVVSSGYASPVAVGTVIQQQQPVAVTAVQQPAYGGVATVAVGSPTLAVLATPVYQTYQPAFQTFAVQQSYGCGNVDAVFVGQGHGHCNAPPVVVGSGQHSHHR